MRTLRKPRLSLSLETIKTLDHVQGGARHPKLPVHSLNPSCGIICFHTPPLSIKK